MTFGDQGMPHGQQPQPYGPYGHQPGPYGQQPDPYAQFVAEQERIRRRRRTRRAVAAGTGVVLVAAIAAGAAMYRGGEGDPEAGSPAPTAVSDTPVPTVDVTLPSDAPTALPSLLARPVIRPEQAFPDKSVRLKDDSRYTRVDLAGTTDCARGMSPELAELIGQGRPCSRLTAALFTDADRRSQVTVTVLSFERVEDASRVFMMASMDPVTYQVVSLDPPPEAGLPTVPPGSAGVFRRVMTVRSVVFANGQWGDGAETEEAAITRQTEGLLSYVNDTVVAYEDGKGV
ncbi:hypothetical protein [Streptomyces bicolor]|uniref:hypothetical protein n=1 Tax=Streptomyces bicolor TaxID=66874 RepID=UPI0004E2411B|nr:hypothetical protein [Streptomyces bicolor]